ncbi:MAG: helix-hairpin-helix domain-containing protein, partial [Prevotella sp.]|nr:helix-hairpin-helix domain-containing protein [Prevotella sp.]
MNYKEFFYFQKSDRSVLVVLLVLVVVISVLLYGLGNKEETTSLETSSLRVQENEQDSMAIHYVKRNTDYKHENDGNEQKYYHVDRNVVERFPFDPNTADSTEFLRLGLTTWQIRSIYRYRAKGGIYREPKDFARLYGLTVKQFRELEPYIRISSDYQDASTLFAQEKPKKTRKDSVIKKDTMNLKD